VKLLLEATLSRCSRSAEVAECRGSKSAEVVKSDMAVAREGHGVWGMEPRACRPVRLWSSEDRVAKLVLEQHVERAHEGC
jgi:hypothetical protein